MECVHNVLCTAHLYNFFVCFYLYNVHIKKCTFDILDKYSTGMTKKGLTKYVEIREQTASLFLICMFKIFVAGMHI